MIKKLILVLLLIIALGYGMLKFLSNSTYMSWGHHFKFENELKIEIDSLEISVGGRKTTIQADSDSLRILEGNINVPKDGYPHKVTFKIYSNDELMILDADSFNCNNCDGNHQYKLKKTKAEYKFLN